MYCVMCFSLIREKISQILRSEITFSQTFSKAHRKRNSKEYLFHYTHKEYPFISCNVINLWIAIEQTVQPLKSEAPRWGCTRREKKKMRRTKRKDAAFLTNCLYTDTPRRLSRSGARNCMPKAGRKARLTCLSFFNRAPFLSAPFFFF